MEKIKSTAIKYSSNLKYLFLCGAIIAAINTLSRADYNFILYLFMFYIWTFLENSEDVQRQDKIGCFYILIYSLLIDIIWCLFWGGKWDTVPTLVHEMTLFFSWFGVFVKILAVLAVGYFEFDMIKSSLINLMKMKSTNKKDNFIPFEEQ